MPDANYEWVCQSCRASNQPGTGKCATCGFPARFTTQQLKVANGVSAEPHADTATDLLVGCAIGGACILAYLLTPSWLPIWVDPRLIIGIVAIAVIAAISLICLVYKTLRTLLRRK